MGPIHAFGCLLGGHVTRRHDAKSCPTGTSEYDPDGFTADVYAGPSGGTTTYSHGEDCLKSKSCLKCGHPL